jgi:uncharacterized protein (TIGR03032 family)
MSKKELLWQKQNLAIRHPSEIFGTSFESAGITTDTLKHSATASFIKLLHKLKISLIVSREYENLLVAYRSDNGKDIEQSFFHLPHPSGIIADRKKNLLYVAATRNPNQIIEFKCSKGNLERQKVKGKGRGYLVPSRSKVYPGQYYFHDLALDGDRLYANSVGMNCIIEVDLSSPEIDKPKWWPTCIERKGKPDFSANFIQLNSIAMGKGLSNSYFSASASKITDRRPGQLNFPVDKRGVIFSGKTRKVLFSGLTRPHSARINKGKIWIANSGYGEVGSCKGTNYIPEFNFNGWTRGLCFVGDVLFVGVSRVLPRFRHYAPGIKSKKQTCSVVAVDVKNKKVIGEITFPFGNQIFAVDYLRSSSCSGFPFKSIKKKAREADIFSVSF